MAQFRFIAGLGNPGSEYEGTRHNIGFSLLDELFQRFGGGGNWRKREGAAVAEITFEGERVTLIRPLEFMNLSGPPIARVVQFVKGTPGELIVVHDDIDLPFGMIRVRPGGSDGGHRGIRSIAETLGTGEFVRLKLGVGRPQDGVGEVSDWVLERFSKEENGGFKEFFDRATEALRCLQLEGVKMAQNKFNERVKVRPKPEEKGTI